MKQLVCEMCGSTDVIKQDGMYVCQACGVKFSVEDAKKMMVTVDNTKKLENLFKVARQALEGNDFKKAAEYYDLILQEDGDNWEATFFNLICRAFDITIAEISSTAKIIGTSLSGIGLKIMALKDENEKELAALKVGTYICSLGESMINSSKESLSSSWALWEENFGSSDRDFSRRQNLVFEYKNRISPVNAMFAVTGDLIELITGCKTEASKSIAIKCWDNGMDGFVFIDKYFASNEMKSTINKYAEKIKKYNPNYFVSSMCSLSGFPSQLRTVLLQAGNKTTNTNTSVSSNGGCYIATAVYGSYDCPEVWTLRRYRDKVLAKSCYGRLFIRTYYAISPTIVKLFGNTNWFNKFWRDKLDRMIEKMQNRGVESTPYDDIDW